MSYAKARTNYIMSNETAPVVGDSHPLPQGPKVIQASLQGTGAVSATIIVETSNEKDFDFPIYTGTIVLSGTTKASDAFAINSNPPFIRGRLTAISGTDAAVSLTVGV